MLQTFIKIILGLIIIILFCWNKFFKQKTSIFLYASQGFTIYQNIIYIIFFILSILLLYLNIRNIFYENKKQTILIQIKNIYFFKRILDIIQEYVLNAPVYAYRKLTDNLNLKFLVELPASYFTAYFYFPKVVVFGVFYLPKILLANIFIFEILLLKQLHYFFKALIILLLPYFIIKIIFFIFFEYSKRRLAHLDLYLDINCDENYDVIINLKHPDLLPISTEFTLNQIIDKYNVMCNYWIIYSKIFKYMTEIKELESFYQSHINIFVYSCYSIGWLYVNLLLFYFE